MTGQHLLCITFARSRYSLGIRASHSIVHRCWGWGRGRLDDGGLTLFTADDRVSVLAAIATAPLRLDQEVDDLLVVTLRVVLVEQNRAVWEHGANTIAVVGRSAALCNSRIQAGSVR